MNLVRPVLALAAVGSLVALVAPSQAAAPTYKAQTLALTDAKGDGNAINDEGLQGNSVNAPVGGYDGYDIVKLDLAGTGTMLKKGRVYLPNCTGFTVKLAFAGAVGPQSIVRVTGGGVVNDAGWWLQLQGGKSTIRYIVKDASSTTGTKSTTIPTSVPAKVDGATITWTVTPADMKATGETLQKFRLSNVGASVRADLVALTVPQWDALPDSGKDFKAC